MISATVTRMRILQGCLNNSSSSRCLVSSSSSSNKATPAAAAVAPGLHRPELFEPDEGMAVVPDDKWNITPAIISLLQRRLLQEPSNPLTLMKQRIVNHFSLKHRKAQGRSPLFAVCEREPRLVSTFDNFDSLLTPADHVSRRPTDTYYANEQYCLRAHTSAHQYRLLKQGFDNFIVVGDVYRRDEIDRTHYPCFHQIEGVRTYSSEELFGAHPTQADNSFGLFDSNTNTSNRTPEKQELLSADASKILVIKLKSALEELARSLFGADVQMRWVDAYFPFTHPSFELEVLFRDNNWLEVLGCGVMEQKLLQSAGMGYKVGWAFGLGLERLAMILYGIPDIRLFWSKDSGFLSQFYNLKPDELVQYRPISAYPQLFMDLSFWLPLPQGESHEQLCAKMRADVRDAIRTVGGDLVEQEQLVDEFFNAKAGRSSQCFHITYRSNERVLTKAETNEVHKQICCYLVERFGVEIR